MNAALTVATLDQVPDLLCRSLEMECDELAPRSSRAFTRKVLANWGLEEEITNRALLIVSELATNAYQHARTLPPGENETIALTLVLLPATLLGIQMADNCCAPPVPRAACPDHRSGRGLRLVFSESDAWTSTPNPDNSGKKVWAFMRCPVVIPGGVTTPPSPPTPRGDSNRTASGQAPPFTRRGRKI
jgi:anti-sigma regulatory factor (Ser/Thr protein kinase)